jgi:hypothetical protein
MKTIASRLRRLEERLRPARCAMTRYDPQAVDRVRGALSAAGFVAGANDSLAAVWARALGVTCVELRALLERRAAGF